MPPTPVQATIFIQSGDPTKGQFEVGSALVQLPVGALVTGAEFTVPTEGLPSNSFEFGQFNLSECKPGPSNNNNPQNNNNASDTPELDGLVLFGGGALGLGGYALYQRRRNRRRS